MIYYFYIQVTVSPPLALLFSWSTALFILSACLFLVAWLRQMGSFSLFLQRGLGFITGGPQVVAVPREQEDRAVSAPVGRQCSRPLTARLSGLLTSPSLGVGRSVPWLFPLLPHPVKSKDLCQAKLFLKSAILILTLRILSSP